MSENITRMEVQTNNKKRFFEMLSLELLIISSLFIVSLFTFAFITREVVYENKRAMDDEIFSFFSAWSGNGFITLMKFFTFFGSGQFLFPAYLILIIYFAISKQFRYCIHIGLIATSSTALMFAIKHITHRHRPAFPLIAGVTNFSFPSGHTLSSFIFFSILIYVIWRSHRFNNLVKWVCSVCLVLFAILIGISRIVLKVHYPTDVIASFCLGFAWATFSFWIMRRISKKNALKNPGDRLAMNS